MNKRRLKEYIWDVCIFVAGILSGILGWIFLPKQVAMQIGAKGQLQNFVPKWLAVTMPFLLIIGGIFWHIKSKDKKKLFVAGIGVLAAFLTVWINAGIK